jgi:hypothetical protein
MGNVLASAKFLLEGYFFKIGVRALPSAGARNPK